MKFLNSWIETTLFRIVYLVVFLEALTLALLILPEVFGWGFDLRQWLHWGPFR